MKEQLEELIQRASLAKTQNNYWNQITKLRSFGDNKMISKCFELIDSNNSRYQQIGIDILCQFGQNRENFITKLLNKIFRILKATANEQLIYSSLLAIGHNNKTLTENQVIALDRFRYSKSKMIRYALVFSLLGLENEKAIEILIHLAKDRSFQVKDWATFGLGTQIKTDNEEIRNTLYKNCFSRDNQTKQEAIKGLANRNDERVREIILNELKSENTGTLILDTLLNIKNGEEFLPELIDIYNKSQKRNNANENMIQAIKNTIEILKD